jgi:hypothetical protein
MSSRSGSCRGRTPQVEELGATGCARFADAGDLVYRQIVVHYDIAAPQRGREDINVEGIAILRSIEHRLRGHAGQAQAGDEGNRLPVSQRHEVAAAVADRRQPYNRAMLVFAPGPSRKTRRSGSINGWVARHSLRRAASPGHCCSAACRASFERQVEPPNRAPHRAGAEPDSVFGQQRGLRQHQCDPWSRADVCAASVGSCAGERLRGARPRLGLILVSPVSRRRIRACRCRQY